MPPRPARIKRHRHFDRITKRASTRFRHLRNLYKDELPPPPLSEKQSLNLCKKCQPHHRRRNKTNHHGAGM